jgi:hypothetical protein
MSRTRFALVAATAGLALVAWATPKSTLTSHVTVGNPGALSLGAVTFGPENILFVGDSRGDDGRPVLLRVDPSGTVEEVSLEEIRHVSHGQNETHAPVMVFMPHDIAGETHILAAYTCTPLVAFPVEDLADGARVFGKTVAELGAGNRPLDIISTSSAARSGSSWRTRGTRS